LTLDVIPIDTYNVVARVLNIPLGEYFGKNETQKELTGSAKRKILPMLDLSQILLKGGMPLGTQTQMVYDCR